MPSSRPTRLFIGRMPYNTRERDLEKFFKNFGRIKDIILKNGYGFVEFDDYRDADDAAYEMNGKELLGERITVEHARGIARNARDSFTSRDSRDSGRDNNYRQQQNRRPVWASRYGLPQRTPYRVVVENLSSRVSWQDLKDYMRKAGEITFADAHRHRKNEGMVEFATYSDMKRCVDKMDGMEIMGRKINCIAAYKRSRSRSRSRRSRSRRRSGTNSRSRSRSPGSRSRSRSSGRDSRSRSKSSGRDSHSKSVEKRLSGSKSPRKRETQSRSPPVRNSTSRSPKRRSGSLKRRSRSRSPKREFRPQKRDFRSRSPDRDSRSPPTKRISHSRSRTPSPKRPRISRSMERDSRSPRRSVSRERKSRRSSASASPMRNGSP